MYSMYIIHRYRVFTLSIHISTYLHLQTHKYQKGRLGCEMGENEAESQKVKEWFLIHSFRLSFFPTDLGMMLRVLRPSHTSLSPFSMPLNILLSLFGYCSQTSWMWQKTDLHFKALLSMTPSAMCPFIQAGSATPSSLVYCHENSPTHSSTSK